jgi:hypothetical protein
MMTPLPPRAALLYDSEIWISACDGENAITRISCAECVQSMAHAKEELLMRIACANCRQAERDRAATQEEPSRAIDEEFATPL